jgi:HAD superfamily hydrolase (TIGR01509 family)
LDATVAPADAFETSPGDAGSVREPREPAHDRGAPASALAAPPARGPAPDTRVTGARRAPSEKIGAILFDLDGTLADTERIHWQSFRAVLLEYGVDIGLEEYRRHFISADGGPEYACRTYGLPITANEMRARKGPIYRSRIAAGVGPMPGAREVLERLGRRRPVAVVTNTARIEAGIITGHLGVDGLLASVIVREDYARSKPAPDSYLAAAAALGLQPAECVVIEDTARGLGAGLAAGMRVIAVPSDLTFDNDFTGAICRLPNLDALTEDFLASLERTS